ncbi:SRPBCC family protein [Paenisporosarcina cavernae]|uniref:SRPBCC family protein n=1 Tax=Paenisporosarcina cavernae TaxID=2320858 RepID=A0A385YPA4_9BACL|nr:SRPBCC family protein [Paenisporosarcina cavernae]AYC28519.1 SRPBCC family protein [Paenisporosarcina cavernae]
MNWSKTRTIAVPIEIVWSLFDESQAARIMPKVLKNEWISKTDEMVGSTYEQTYQEGKLTESYVVVITEYENTPDRKIKKLFFQLANTFDMELSFNLEKASETETKFTYSGSNKGTNFLGRAMLLLGSSKKADIVFTDFLNRVEAEALKDYKEVKTHEVHPSSNESAHQEQ